MKKILKKLWLPFLIFTILLCYLIWWQRGVNIGEMDESNLTLKKDNPIAKEDNLFYTLQNQDALKEFLIPLQKNFHSLYQLESFLNLEKDLPADILFQKHAQEILNTNHDLNLSLEEYLSGIDIDTIHQSIVSNGGLETLIQKIKNQNFYADLAVEDGDGAILEKRVSTDGIQDIVNTLNVLSLYENILANYEKAFEYREASYLLGDKINQNNTLVFYLLGNAIEQKALLTLHYSINTFNIPKNIQKLYLDTLHNYPINNKEKYNNAYINEYHTMKEIIKSMGKQEIKSGMTFSDKCIISLSPIIKVFDEQETIKILNKYFNAFYGNKTINLEDIDPRFGENEMLKNSIFASLFRKNIIGIKSLSALLPRYEGSRTFGISLEKYYNYLLELIEKDI